MFDRLILNDIDRQIDQANIVIIDDDNFDD